MESDVLQVAIDDTSVWGIKTNGDVFIRTGVSVVKPEGTGTRGIRAASDLVHISALNSMLWGLDIYNHVQIYQGLCAFIFLTFPNTVESQLSEASSDQSNQFEYPRDSNKWSFLSEIEGNKETCLSNGEFRYPSVRKTEVFNCILSTFNR